MRHVIGSVVVLAMFLSGPSPSLGADVESTEGTFQLGEIIVSAKPDSGVESAGTVHRITAAQIRDQGVRTLDEALQLIPGVTIREGAEGTPRVDIRGFRTRHVQLFLNGIPVMDTFDGQFDPTIIPAEIISEIKVTTGGGSVLYGPGGNGGAINIITKSGKKGLHGLIAGEAGEGERYLGKGSLSGAGEKADVYAAVNVMDRDRFPLANDFVETDEQVGDYRDNSDWQRSTLFGNLGYRLTDKTQLGLTVSHLTGENGKPPVTNYDRNDPFTKRVKYERIDDIEHSLVQLAFDHQTDSPFQIRGWGFFSQSDAEENRYDDDTYSTQSENGAYHQDANTRIYGASTQIRYGIGKAGATTLGLTAENDSWDADGYSIDRNGDAQNYADDRDMQVYSAALEYEQALGERVGFVLGYGQHFLNRDGNGDDTDFSYLLGATYDVTDSTRLRANHARKIRFPSIKQLYDGDAGNEDLDTEVTLHYEAGITQQLPAGTTLGITGFIIDAEDFIEKDTEGVNSNYQKLWFAGVETELTLRPIDAIMLRLAVSWLDTEDKSDDSEREELQYRPEWTTTVECRYRSGVGFTAYGSLKYVANQYFYDDDDTPPLEKKKLNDFTVVNIKLSQQVFVNGLEIYAGADNLLDEDYEESYGLPQPGRTIYGGVEYRF
jgi:vitamin B12 transporter